MLRNRIKTLMEKGVYDQNKIFNYLYPEYRGHYSTLRNEIAKVKNDAGIR